MDTTMVKEDNPFDTRGVPGQVVRLERASSQRTARKLMYTTSTVLTKYYAQVVTKYSTEETVRRRDHNRC